jgi:YHS domain-containing protein
MKTRFLLASAAIVALLVVGSLTAAEKEKAEFTATCPVSGKAAKESSYADIKAGKKVYFCCEGCPKAFAKDPEKYTKQTRLQLLETGQMIQVGCPISGKPVNDEVVCDIGHAKVGFCCKNCQGKFAEAEADGQLEIAFADISKGFTLQTVCPISGKPIKVASSLEHDGKNVYFCCDNCPKAFKADPAKYIDKLPQFEE